MQYVGCAEVRSASISKDVLYLVQYILRLFEDEDQTTYSHPCALDSGNPCRNDVLLNTAVNTQYRAVTKKTGQCPVCRAEYRSFRREQPAGVRQGGRTLTEGQGWSFWQPPAKARNAGFKRQSGRLSFGYFSLAEQRKVSRLRVREPDSNKLSR